MVKETENIDKNTNERILQAATEVFALNGYYAAGVDEIAR